MTYSAETWEDTGNIDATLYVPSGTKEKYKTTDGWKEFKDIVEMETESIVGVIRTNHNEGVPIHNLSGHRVTTVQKGINIIDGKKVIVR